MVARPLPAKCFSANFVCTDAHGWTCEWDSKLEDESRPERIHLAKLLSNESSEQWLMLHCVDKESQLYERVGLLTATKFEQQKCQLIGYSAGAMLEGHATELKSNLLCCKTALIHLT